MMKRRVRYENMTFTESMETLTLRGLRPPRTRVPSRFMRRGRQFGATVLVTVPLYTPKLRSSLQSLLVVNIGMSMELTRLMVPLLQRVT